MNLAPVLYYQTEEPFIDRFKTAAGWSARGTDTAVPVDRYGNPLAMPTGATEIGTVFAIDPVAEAPTDIYVMTYGGTGAFNFTGGRILSAAAGTITFEMTARDTTYVYMSVQNMTASDPLHDIHVVRQDQVNLFNAGEIFNPTFIAKTSPWSIVRFMDWENTNNSGDITWDTRAVERDATWASTQSSDGVPIEIMVKLANKTHTDMWYNVPTKADDFYVRSALTLIRDTLDPSLKVHVEYSNEPWNFSFPASHYMTQKAAAIWGVDANHDGTIDINSRAESLEAGHMVYYGYRSAQIASIAHDVFGTAGASRVLDVLGSQTVWADLTTYYTLNGVARAQSGTTGSLFSEYAVTTYFGWQTDTAANRDTVLGWARSGAAGMTAAFHELEFGGSLSDNLSLAAQRGFYAAQAAIANANGMQLVAYEGGAHLVPVGFSTGETAEVTAFFGRLMEDPRMGALYTKMASDFAAAGGKSLIAFSDVGGNSQFGYWGSLDTIYDNGSPRYDALVAASLQYKAAAGTTTTTTTTTAPITTAPTTTAPTTTTTTTTTQTTPTTTTPTVVAPVTTIPTLGAGRATLTLNGGGTVTVGSNGFIVGADAAARTLVFADGGLPGSVTVGIPTGAPSFEINPVNAGLLRLSAPVATIAGPIAIVEGTNAAGQILTIVGGESHAIIAAAGPDRLTGGTAPDIIFGGAGADTIDGGAGNDHLYGQSPNGGADGADSISGGDGGDYIQGNAGNDTLDGGAGSDRIYGGADNDLVLGGAGNDTINGNLGDDTLMGGADNDSIRGGQGNDLIYGDAGDDILGGDLGNDTIVGGAGIDRMTGGEGADTFRFAPGDAAYVANGDAWLTDVITDFTRGVDKLALGFTVASVLTGAAQTSVRLAANLAQTLLNNHPGDHEVAAVNVGSDTMLFFAGNGGGVIDSAIRLLGGTLSPTLSDFA